MASNLMKRGTRWLTSQLHRHASEEITYMRGSETYFMLATRGRSEFTQNDSANGGGIITMETVDWIIRMSDLPIEPQPNDEISDGDRSYRVTAYPPGACFRYSGAHRKMYRVHCTKL